MSDIVERLRDPTSRWVALSEPDPLRLEAAAEIERLRAALRELIGEHEVYHGNIAAGTWERARAALGEKK